MATLAVACGLAAGCAESDTSSPGTPATTVAAVAGCADDDYLGPWAECREADWVRNVAEAVGYEIAGDTGSALIARDDRHSFYIWATRDRGSLAGASRLGCRIGSTNVWAGVGGMDDWRYWQAQGYTFWMSAGPLMKSKTPDPCDLDTLVHESQVQPPPSEAG